MGTVRDISDGKNVQLLQKVVVKKPQEVVVSFPNFSENRDVEEPLHEKFERFFQQWYAETAGYSNPDLIRGHPMYLKMVKLGKPAIPLILRKLQEKPCFLFAALKKISGENPVLKAHAENFNFVLNDWLKWGKEKNKNF